MSLTSLNVANRALTHVGTRQIASLSDTSKEAQQCNLNYSLSRRAVLRSHFWNFAMKTVALGDTERNDQSPVIDYTYSFDIPTDFLRLKSIDDDEVDYQIRPPAIFTDATQLNLKYVADITNVDLWDPMCFEAISLHLAWSISYVLTQSRELKDSLWSSFVTMLKQGKFTDSTEDPQVQLDRDDWTRSRFNVTGVFVRDPQTW